MRMCEKIQTKVFAASTRVYLLYKNTQVQVSVVTETLRIDKLFAHDFKYSIPVSTS
jgi:hypothetical protein